MQQTGATGRRREATRERLLDAGRDLLAREGIQGASVEHICEIAGYTRGAFYSNFSSKDELVIALFEREFAALVAQLEHAVDPQTYAGLGVAQALPAIMERFMELRPPDRDFYLLHAEFALRGVRGDIGGQEFNALWQGLLDQVLAVIQRVLDDLGLRLTIDLRSAGTILLGTYDAELREAVVAGRPMDRTLMLQTLPALLLSATEPVESRPPS
ncbi:TetR/AcrR family transcriptional regulator [Aeromicrobium sp. CF4.19]|uniref:TetR/AcrR family transcriptional regulator n=1 Tax=Aeromicrobium sp. CF4.19 TaxID=3373082 RepID=UPI003EE42869